MCPVLGTRLHCSSLLTEKLFLYDMSSADCVCARCDNISVLFQEEGKKKVF